MIEINLLPGARKGKRTRAAAFDFGALAGGIAARVRDPWLISAVAGLVVGIGATGFMWWRTGARETALLAQEQTATQDSIRFGAVIAQRNSAEAQRDSVIRQIAIIRALDGSRFTWPHILDEINRALTPYTWLMSLQQTSAVAAVAPEVETGVTDARTARSRLAAQADSAELAASGITMRLVGQTADIQAMTRFLENLQRSAWFETVAMVRTENVIAQPTNKEVTQFTFDLKVGKPDPKSIRMVPLSIAVR